MEKKRQILLGSSTDVDVEVRRGEWSMCYFYAAGCCWCHWCWANTCPCNSLLDNSFVVGLRNRYTSLHRALKWNGKILLFCVLWITCLFHVCYYFLQCTC